MLFKTIDELKVYVAIAANSDFKTISPDIQDAEEEYLVAALGQAQYDLLEPAYQAAALVTDLSAPLQQLLKRCQRALANLAYATWVDIGQVDISEAGIRIITDANMKTAFAWQVAEVKNYFLKKGFAGLEKLLAYMEEHKADYAAWSGSPAYTITRQYFLNSAGEFSQHYNINRSRRTFLALQSVMKKVEDFELVPTLTAALYAAIKAEIAAGTVSTDNTALLAYVRPAVAHLTVAKACAELSVEFSDNALTVSSFASGDKTFSGGNNVGIRPSTVAEYLALKKNEAERDGRNYLKQLKDYLNANATVSRYADYFSSGSYLAPASGDNAVFVNDKCNKYYAAF